jgi:hypothetical protein
VDDREGVDMTQTTGGHWLDTGDGLTSVDPLVSEPAEAPAAPTGRAIEHPAQAAWRGHVEHRLKCSQCSHSVFRCARGNKLWQAYLDISR